MLMKELQTIMKKITDRMYPLPPEDLEKLISFVDSHEIVKGGKLLDVGSTAKSFFFVKKGLLRLYYYKNGHDVTELFACEGNVMSCFYSTFLDKPSRWAIEALEPTTYYQLSYQNLLSLLKESLAINGLYRRFLEINLVSAQLKADVCRFESARDRYIRFRREFPEIAKRASVNHIASYLLMAPESLSRIRGKL